MQAQLIEELLDFSGTLAGKIRFTAQLVDLVGIVNAAIDTVRTDAETHAIHIETKFDEDARLISGDPHRLQQVVWNLLSNAIKFSRNGGRIGVRLQRLASEIRLIVNDTGKGIPASFLPHVFDPFSQADTTSMRRHGGLGLGLAIVHQIVELHGGSAEVRSKEGSGATFTIRLPVGNVQDEEIFPVKSMLQKCF
jgi:signal transduction histidine kinase